MVELVRDARKSTLTNKYSVNEEKKKRMKQQENWYRQILANKVDG